MDAITRYRLLTLYGELATGRRDIAELDAELRDIIGEEKARSYTLGVEDTKKGKWGPC